MDRTLFSEKGHQFRALCRHPMTSPVGPDPTFPSIVASRAHTTPDVAFVRFEDAVLSYAQLDARAAAVAAGFAVLGITKGDRVAIIAPNRIEMVELFFGLARLGAVQLPLNAFLKGEFLRHQLANSKASVLVVDEAGLAAVGPLIPVLPELRHLIVLDGPAGDGIHLPHTNYADIRAAPPDAAPAPEVSPTDTASIMYTSGTTGLPKGCVLSHGYYVRSGRRFCEALQLTDEDVVWSPLPLFHAGSHLSVIMLALLSGARLAIEREFSARACITRAREVGATLLVGSGAIGAALLSLPVSPDDREHPIKTMMIVPLPEEVQDRLGQRYGCDVLTEGFGQTECTPISIAPRLSTDRDHGGCGLPAADLDVTLFDDKHRVVANGHAGEICLRPREPHAMFDGYLGEDGRTVLDPFENGWYHTGDSARWRDSGQLMFVDRKKDALRRRGENVSSLELEAAIARHPGVAAVAVHAVPSSQTEDDIKACIVPVPGAHLDAASLFEYLSTHIPYFAVPRYVELVDSLPTNAVGRVMKHVLRDRQSPHLTWDFEALGLVVPRADRRSASPGGALKAVLGKEISLGRISRRRDDPS